MAGAQTESIDPIPDVQKSIDKQNSAIHPQPLAPSCVCSLLST